MVTDFPSKFKLPLANETAPLQVSPASIVAVPPLTANSAAFVIVTTAFLPIVAVPVTFNLVSVEPSPKFKAPPEIESPVVMVNSSRTFVVPLVCVNLPVFVRSSDIFNVPPATVTFPAQLSAPVPALRLTFVLSVISSVEPDAIVT